MKLTTFAQSLHDLNIIKSNGLDEVILSTKDFSRFGRLTFIEFQSISTRAKELGLKVIFEWDILMTQTNFERKLQEVKAYLDLADSVRVQDPGAFHWLVENTQKTLQFIAENGNHNLESLVNWIQFSPNRTERIILSIELPRNTIEEYVRSLNVPCELLGLGRILLFYSPRHLLSPLKEIREDDEFEALGESEESPHKGFPIVQNRHGTFMFHIKDFSLIEYANELKQMGLHYFRIDLRFSDFSDFQTISDLIADFNQSQFDKFKNRYPQDLMRGFYLVNKTDVLFSKLKNNRLQKREGNYIGEVLESYKSSHLAIMVKNPRGLKKSDKLKILHPKGNEIEVQIYSLKNLEMNDVDEVQSGEMALIQFVNGVWVKSQVFLN